MDTTSILCWAAGNPTAFRWSSCRREHGPPQETPMSDLFGFVVRILTSPVRYLGGQARPGGRRLRPIRRETEEPRRERRCPRAWSSEMVRRDPDGAESG